LELVFQREKSPKLLGYCDASWANLEDYASISGYAFLYGNGLVSWSSKKQPVIALSSTEAEYIAGGAATQEALWLRNVLEEIGFAQDCTSMMEDNEGCLNLTKNPQDINRTRHIQVKYHFLRDHVKKGEIVFNPCRTHDQLADLLTKGLNGVALKTNPSRLGLMSKNLKHGRELESASNCMDTNVDIDVDSDCLNT
jgi:hypothetical protein